MTKGMLASKGIPFLLIEGESYAEKVGVGFILCLRYEYLLGQ
ncbi:hypothetical protein [Phascolarctobacterium succinatutens]